ncbi:hypothetical protein AAVH_14511 [Aphelenchoides avenae]|nr:hypothetical protein AAVH_14511 [Aphelenchus avenae]
MLKPLVLVLALAVPLVELKSLTDFSSGVGILNTLGSLLFNRPASENSTAAAHHALSSLAAFHVTDGPALASHRPKHHRPRQPKLLARRSAQRIGYGNDVDGEDPHYGDFAENRNYVPDNFPHSDGYPSRTDDEEQPLAARSSSSRSTTWAVSSQLTSTEQLDDSRQQGEPLPTEIDAEAEEAPEDSNGNDQDDPNDNINRDGHISDDDQEDDSQAADSQPDDEYYDSKKTAKRAKRTPNNVMQLKRKGRLHKPRLAKKQRGNVNH